MTDLQPHEVEYVGTTACAFGSLILAIQRDDREQIMLDLTRILNAATRYGNATKTKPADRALNAAIAKLADNDR